MKTTKPWTPAGDPEGINRWWRDDTDRAQAMAAHLMADAWGDPLEYAKRMARYPWRAAGEQAAFWRQVATHIRRLQSEA